MKQRFSKQKQQGISLLEVMLSLAIIAIILVMATRYFFVANQNSKVNATRIQIAAVLQGIEHWKHQNADFSALTMPVLVTGHFIPKTAYVTAANTLNNPWSQPYSVDVTTDANNPTIKTTFSTQAVCNQVKTSFPGSTCSGASNNEFAVQLDSVASTT